MKQLIYIVSVLSLYNCSTLSFHNKVKSGDILFIEAKKENLSGAISRVTKSEETSISYDHIGIVEVENGNKFILHSTTGKGSVKENLKQFLKRNKKDKRTQSLYRLKDNYHYCITKAIENANSMLGKPYNFSYILNENSYYCSDFVERSFRDCSIFELKPMTFINPETNKIDDFWQEFYKKQNLEVPEGQLGCNPNGLSQSDKIEKISILKP